MTPTALIAEIGSHATRFWANVAKTETCWLWVGSMASGGYGRFYIERRGIKAHRAAWLLHTGRSLAAGEYVLHKCDNRICVNPGHLWIGSKGDNNADRDKKGRTAKRAGHGRTDLSESDVEQIKRFVTYGISQSELARAVGVHQTSISKIIRGETWR